MLQLFARFLETFNQLLTAGIAITAFSLLLYALTFNLRDRVARSFATILACVVVVFVGDAIASVAQSAQELTFWLRLQWVGIVLLPPAYLHFSDALLATTGRPSRGRRRLAVRVMYLVSVGFLVTIPLSWLVGSLVTENEPAPYLQGTGLTIVFTLFYAAVMLWALVNFVRASQRTVTSSSRRRMTYLLAGASAPALGSFPYLLFGSGFAGNHQLIFWLALTASNLLVSVLLVIMAYAVAFFGVAWPDRVVKRRLFKWLMRGPVTASTVLAVTTLVRRLGEHFGQSYSEAVPIVMVGSLLLMEYMVTLAAPYWERWLFHGGDRADMTLLQSFEERVLTSGDLKQFLEAVLAAVCDRLQIKNAFIVSLGEGRVEMLVAIGEPPLLQTDRSGEMTVEHEVLAVEEAARNGHPGNIIAWGNYWLVPLHAQVLNVQDQDWQNQSWPTILGLLGVPRHPEHPLEEDQREALERLSHRAALALEDRARQQQVVNSLARLTPQVDRIQRLRAASRYDGTSVLTDPALLETEEQDYEDLTQQVKDALTHYWGGPKLTESPLIRMKIVQRALEDHQGNPANALRAILRQAVEQVKPDGERRFTGEWILYNILEMKFMEGRKVREVAMRLAMSEADLYRKQRVAIESVATAILEMEQRAQEEVQGEAELLV